MRLQRRIIVVSTVGLFLILLIVNSAVYLFFKQFMEQSELTQIKDQGQSIVETIGDHQNPSLLMDNYIIGDGMLRVIRSGDHIEKVLTKSREYRQIPTTYSESEASSIVRYNNKDYAVYKQPFIWNDGTVVTLEYVESISHYSNAISLLQTVLLAASVLVLIPSVAASVWLSRFILTPIRALIATMNEIRSNGTLKKMDVSSKNTDELTQMRITFNQMIDLLKDNFEKQQQFVSDASHELKTPLTVIESYSTLLKRWGKKDPAILDEAVEAIYSEALRMRGMTQQMLDLAQGDQYPDQPLTELNATEITQEAAERLSRSFNRDIHFVAKEPISFLGQEDLFKQLLFILIENAIKYSKKDIVIRLYTNQTFLILEIEDKGIGIPENEQTAIFERFYRVSEDRNRESGGSGLGLSIAKKIVEQFEGTIHVQSKIGIGSTFIVNLPLRPCKEVSLHD
ncbi:sensor histidine kinase [Alkalicoccobacillus gibsonii]|uniref:sensor histidine kinase n=1 Tax=Alkalicoccobacillus gibsonii TaxID=79881 RepID=UPI003511B05A